jgi:molybdopterin converting factor small subunit
MPKVRVKYFGKLREQLGVKSEEYELEEGTTLKELLLNHVPQRHKQASETWIETVFRTIRGEIARNKDGTPVLRDQLIIISGKSPRLRDKLKDGDEVTIMPPFGGG